MESSVTGATVRWRHKDPGLEVPECHCDLKTTAKPVKARIMNEARLELRPALAAKY